MKMTPLRKLLKDNKKCNPFNDAYDSNEMLALIKTSMSPAEFSEDPLRFTIGITDFMNTFYIDFYALLEENILSANISHKDLIELLFVAFNRNYLVVLKKQIEHTKKQKRLNQNDLYKFRITTMNAGIGPVEINSSLEVEVDALNHVLNYTRYFEKTPVAIDSSLPELHPIQVAQHVALTAAYYTIIKSVYDDSIWTYGHWTRREDDSKATFDVIYPHAAFLLINKVGLIRLQKNTTSGVIQLIPELVNKTPFGKIVIDVSRQHKKPKRLKSVKISGGYIIPELGKGNSEEQDLIEIRNTVELDTFYAFLDSPVLKYLEGLQLPDLIKLFSLLQDICKKAALKEFDDSIYKLGDIYRFPIKIDKTVLHDYFMQRSDYTTKQINTFIGLITCKYGDRINLWDRPIVNFQDNLYINHLPTLNPILLNLIDYWLDQGGFSLDERGKMLEKYLTSVIGSGLQEKKFEGRFPTSAKIYNNQKQFEEIDFLLNLKETVIVAEVKCIKYPFEARDHHNALNRLMQAAIQVKRKMEFLKKYSSEVSSQTGDLEGKSFVPIIVTNYPIYSTFKIEDIVVTDFYLLEGYFAEGSFTDAQMHRGGASKVTKKHSYYSNEVEMNNNIQSFLENPPAVSTLKEMFEIRPFKTSMDDLDYDIFVTSAQLKTADKTNILSHLNE
jgi:hypothetical protein